MKECNNCKYKDCWEHAEPCDSCTNLMGKMGKPTRWEPQNNYYRLISKTPEEIAELFSHLCCPYSLGGNVVCNAESRGCYECWMAWLKSSVGVRE